MTKSFSLTIFLVLTLSGIFGTHALVAQSTSRSGFPADPESLANLRRFPCGGIVIFDEYFNTDTIPAGWKVADYDGLTPNHNILFLVPNPGWQSVIDFKDTDSVNRVLASPSWYEGSVDKSDDYLISPKVFIPENACLSWYAYSQDKFFPESYEIRISTTTPDSAGFMAHPPALVVAEEGDEFTYRSTSLDAFGGQEAYIAFRHTSSDKFILVLDDIRLAQVEQRDIAMYYVDDIVANPNDEITITGAVINRGLDTVSFDTVGVPMVIHYQIGDSAVQNDTLNRVFTLLPNDTIQFAHGTVWKPTESDVYRLRVWVSGFGTDDNVLNDSIGRWQGIGTRTAIDPDKNSWGVNIYPNPANDQVFIDFLGQVNGEINLSIYDLSGHKVSESLKLSGSHSKHELSLTGLVPGIYFVRIYDQTGNGLMRKLIKLKD